MRFCRAEMPSYCVKALENTQSILCGLFLVCEHFCSGRTASHRTALDFRGIFVLLDAGGLPPAKEKRAKSTEKTGCPTHGFPDRRWLIFSDVHAAGENEWNSVCACGRKLTLRGFFDRLAPLTGELSAQPTEGFRRDAIWPAHTFLHPTTWAGARGASRSRALRNRPGSPYPRFPR